MRKYGMTAVLLLMAGVGPVLAAPPVSGPPAGARVPGPFRPLHVTGPEAGTRSCLYCKFGARPVAMVFARELSPAVIGLLQKLDAATAANEGLGSCAIVLGDADKLVAPVKEVAGKAGIRTLILAVDGATGPPSYRLAGGAAVTVLLYRRHTVHANHAFRTGELTDAATATILADLAKMLSSN